MMLGMAPSLRAPLASFHQRGHPSTKGRNFVPGFGTHETKSSTEGK